MSREIKMTAGHPGKLMFVFALPLMFGNIFQQLYTVVDTAIVGKGVGMDALAALGTVDWLNWMFIGIAQGFTQGFSVQLAQKFGEGDIPGLKRSLGVSLVLSIWIALGLTAFSQLGLPLLTRLLGIPEQLQGMAMLYDRILFAGIPAMLFFNFCASVLRAVGNSKTPLYAMVAASLTNIILDCLAVFVLDWGIVGAALATVVSQVLSGVVCAIKIWKTPELRIGKADLAFDSGNAKRLMYLGAPIAAQNVVISIGGMAVQSVVNRFDTSFIAGFTSSNKLYGVLEIAALSYGYAVTTYTGQNYGAGKWDRIRKGTRWAVIISLITSVIIGGVMILLGRPITMLFISTESPELAAAAGEAAYQYLFAMSAALPVLYLAYAYRSALQGMGNTRITLFSGTLELIVRVGAAYLVGLAAWKTGLLYIEPLAWISAAALLGISYYVNAAKLGKQQDPKIISA